MRTTITEVNAYQEHGCNFIKPPEGKLIVVEYWEASKQLPGAGQFGSQTFLDGLDLAKQELGQWLAENNLVQTKVLLGIPDLVITAEDLKMTQQALTARRLAIDAFTALASPFVQFHGLGLKLLAKAEQIDVQAVASLEAEMELAQDSWEDTIEYPHRMPQYEVIAQAFRDGKL